MRRSALTLTLLLTLAGCHVQSSSSSSSPTPPPTTTSAIHANGKYANLRELRFAAKEAGLSCPDWEWTPAPQPTGTGMLGDGMCGDHARIVLTKEDEASKSHVLDTIEIDALYQASEGSTPGVTEAYGYIKGANWVIQTPTKSVMRQIITTMGGQQVTP